MNKFLISSFHRYGYGDASSLVIYENMVHRPFVNRSSLDESGPEFCGSRLSSERIHGTNSNIIWNSMFQVDSSSFNELSTGKIHEPKHNKFFSFGGNESTQLHPNAQDQLMPNDKLLATKRKASDIDLDLNLSLKLSPRVSGEKQLGNNIVDHEVDSNLSLSLCSQSSSSHLKKSLDLSKEKGERASTLDLTI